MLAIISSVLPYFRFLANKYVIMAVTAAGLWFTYNHMSNKIDSLETEKAIKEKTIQEQIVTIEQQKRDYEKIIISKKEFEDTIKELEKTTSELREVLYRENKGKKSIEELARKKTKLIEKKVNAATEQVFDCFESISNDEDC